MSVTDTLLAFYLALDHTPGDELTLKALADCYEEHGQPGKAACVRWTQRNGYVPFRFVRGKSGLNREVTDCHDGWFWWANADGQPERDCGHPRSCRLPGPVWSRLRHSAGYVPAVFKEYASMRECYEALFEIWHLVEPAEPARRRGERRT